MALRFATIFAVILLTLSLSSCHHSADKEKSDIAGIVPVADDGSQYPAMEAGTPHVAPDTMLIYVDGLQYKVSANGKVYSPEAKFCFAIGNEGAIETLFFAQKGSSLFLFYTDTTDDGSASFVKRIDIASGKTLWTSDVAGIAMGRPVIKGQFAYIGSFGFVGKLKLKNGDYDRKYANLNNDGRFEKFQDIVFINNREAAFVAPHPFSTDCDTVVINDITGEIIRMN